MNGSETPKVTGLRALISGASFATRSFSSAASISADLAPVSSSRAARERNTAALLSRTFAISWS